MKRRISIPALSILGYFLCSSAQGAPGLAAGAQLDPPTRSIRQWAQCGGEADQAKHVAAAIDAAKGGAFTLVVDCPIRIRIGMDIARPIFIDDNTTVKFAAEGLFIVDNELLPAFVLANTKSVRLIDWRVLYVGSEPIDTDRIGGVYMDGAWIRSGASPAGAFNDSVLTPWLATHRNLVFEAPGQRAKSIWSGPTKFSAIFFLLGDTSDVEITGLRLLVPPAAKGSHFIPVGISAQPGYKSGQNVVDAGALTATAIAVPRRIRFSDVDLDGYYMGWVGTFEDSVFVHIRAHRYGDLEDDEGEHVGGAGKWFAPPHLFYVSSAAFKYLGSGGRGRGVSEHDGDFPSRRVRIEDVIDFGNRVGRARDRGGADSISGYANSLKIGAIEGLVDGYQSYRPDGLMDLTASTDLVIRNVVGTYDSTFLNGLFPGVRFPGADYRGITVENLTLVDTAAQTQVAPIGGCNDPGKVFGKVNLRNVNLLVNKWIGAARPVFMFHGDDNHIDIVFSELLS
jgi:hypothetical protein